jgi:ethanolamine ammonia-lyase small subunit
MPTDDTALPTPRTGIDPVPTDPWADLRRFTAARLGLGRAGVSLPTREVLGFGLAHALARDAVHLPLNMEALASGLAQRGLNPLSVTSQATDRASYLLRPDLGRRLADADAQALTAHPASGCDLLLVIADGLSSMAIERHALPLVDAILASQPPGWRLGPVVLARQARVALGDDIGAALRAPMIALLVGERPGLSAPDSLGIYLTRDPRPGRTDAERNCISNVRPEGLGYASAAHKLWWLCQAAKALGQTGVALKDNSDETLITAGEPGGDTRLPR